MLFSRSVVSDFGNPMDWGMSGFPVLHHVLRLLNLMSIELVMPSDHLVLCRSLLLLPAVFPSIRVFSNESALHVKWPQYWSFNFSLSPSSEYSGLISFRMDWYHFLAVQKTLKSLLQNDSSKAPIIRCSTFLQSNSYIHT